MKKKTDWIEKLCFVIIIGFVLVYLFNSTPRDLTDPAGYCAYPAYEC